MARDVTYTAATRIRDVIDLVKMALLTSLFSQLLNESF